MVLDIFQNQPQRLRRLPDALQVSPVLLAGTLIPHSILKTIPALHARLALDQSRGNVGLTLPGLSRSHRGHFAQHTFSASFAIPKEPPDVYALHHIQSFGSRAIGGLRFG